MLKMQILGNLGKDAVMHQHGTDNVLQFSVAHTDKYKDSAGMLVQKTTWVECSWCLRRLFSAAAAATTMKNPEAASRRVFGNAATILRAAFPAL